MACAGRTSPQCPVREYVVPGLGILLAVSGMSLLVAFGFLYIKPFLKVRHLVAGGCTTTSAVVGDAIRCSCSQDNYCVSGYMCLHIQTNLTTQDGHVRENITLYDSWNTLELHANTHKCSFHKCHSSERINQLAMSRFANTYGVQGRSYSCYYSPEPTTDYVVLDVVTSATAVNTLLWPGLALLVGCVLFTVNLLNLRPCRRRPTALRPGSPHASPTHHGTYDRIAHSQSFES